MSANKIHADQIQIDDLLVQRLLADQFPDWAKLPLTAVPSAGTENAIYRLGDDMAIRLPYRPVKDDQLAKLERWLPRLAPQLPLAIPEPLARGRRSEDYPVAWSIVRWLDGDEASLERLADPVATASTLAAFVRALIAIDPAGGPAPGTHNFWRGVPLKARDEVTRKCIKESEGLVDTRAVMKAWEHDLTSSERAQLGKLGEERAGDAGTDAGRGLQAVCNLALLGVGFDELVETGVELGDTSLEDLDQRLQVSPDAGIRVLESILLGDDHVDELASSSCQMAHLTFSGALSRGRRRPDLIGEAGQQAGVEVDRSWPAPRALPRSDGHATG